MEKVITMKYFINKRKKIRLFGKQFVENNKEKLEIKINGKKKNYLNFL